MDAEGLIETSSNGLPRLYGTLSASFHLESLVPEHSAVLGEVNAMIADWFGDRLRWSWSSVHAEVSPFRRDDLELVEGWPEGLRNPYQLADESTQETASWVASAASDHFGLMLHGAVERNAASPYQYRFYGELPEPGVGPVFRNISCLSVCVPLNWPLADFYGRVLAIAAKLPLRWGAAGLGYGAWEFDAENATRSAVFAHGRRYAGYDVGHDTGSLQDWAKQLRTVSWLTFLGARHVETLTAKQHLPQSTTLVEVTPLGGGLVLRAGERPEDCDLNRLRLAPSYVQVDQMVRPVRARVDVDFGEPWSESTTEKWLRRFEKRIY